MSDHTFCSYNDGMFSADARAHTSVFGIALELEAACFHEAGHAVVGYLFGLGCSSVSVVVSYVDDFAGVRTEVGFVGMARESRAANRLVNKDLATGKFTEVLARYGIFAAAGPAAERKFRIKTEIPLQLLGATEGDDRQIHTVSKVLEAHGRSSAAYKRLVWGAAQRLMSVPQIWSCVSYLADELYQRAEVEDYKNAIFTLPGPTARAIMKGRQVTPAHAVRLLADSLASSLAESGEPATVATKPPVS